MGSVNYSSRNPKTWKLWSTDESKRRVVHQAKLLCFMMLCAGLRYFTNRGVPGLMLPLFSYRPWRQS